MGLALETYYKHCGCPIGLSFQKRGMLSKLDLLSNDMPMNEVGKKEPPEMLAEFEEVRTVPDFDFTSFLW